MGTSRLHHRHAWEWRGATSHPFHDGIRDGSLYAALALGVGFVLINRRDA